MLCIYYEIGNMLYINLNIIFWIYLLMNELYKWWNIFLKLIGFVVEGLYVIGLFIFCFLLCIRVKLFFFFLSVEGGMGRDILVFFESFSLSFFVMLIFCGENIFLVFFIWDYLWVFCLYWMDILVFFCMLIIG